MLENARKISVKFVRKDYEEIYFSNKQANIFLSPEIKTDFLITALSFPLSVLSIVYFTALGRAWILPFVFTAIFITGCCIYLFKLWHLLKWKKQVRRYLKGLEKVNNFELMITDEALTDIQDDTTTIIKWNNFQKSIITEASISLTGTEMFFLPRKSVAEGDFIFLKEFITNKIQGA